MAPSLVSTHFYLCSLTFSFRSVKKPQYGGRESSSVIN